MKSNDAFFICFAATLFLTGLSWFLQLIQLPMLEKINAAEFPALIGFQRRRNTLLMAPLMIVEMIAAVYLTFPENTPFNHRHMFHSWVLLVFIWMITLARHVPLNRKLAAGYNCAALRSLARWNWARTLLWTGRCAFLLAAANVC